MSGDFSMKKGKPKKQKPSKSPKTLKSFKKIAHKLQDLGLTPEKPVQEFPTPPVSLERPSPSRSFELPAQYGEDGMVLLVRDPWWLYAYWEVTPLRDREVADEMQRLGAAADKTVLRVYDITGSSLANPRSFFDIEITFLAGNWYIDVGIPDREWVAELGRRARDGRFFMLVRSNIVRTPRFGVSDVLDEEWLLPDDLFWKLFGLSGGLADRRSSLDVREILEKYLKSIVSSEGMSSFSQSAKMLRNDSRLDVSAKLLERP